MKERWWQNVDWFNVMTFVVIASGALFLAFAVFITLALALQGAF